MYQRSMVEYQPIVPNTSIRTIVKRDGRMVPFNDLFIDSAIGNAFGATDSKKVHRYDVSTSETLTRRVVKTLEALYDSRQVVTVEQVQDAVETVLESSGEHEVAKNYAAYRLQRAEQRQAREVPQYVKDLYWVNESYFPEPIQQFQFFDKYSSFNHDENRREAWTETVDRTMEELRRLSGDKLSEEDYVSIHEAILNFRVMPSMRMLAMAGKGLNPIGFYNCSFVPVDSIDSFVEALVISMAGCGVGFSVERQFISNLPRIKRHSPTRCKIYNYVIDDSAEGWANALRFGLETWFDGDDVTFDYSKIRAAGSVLKRKGGRASGPEPFKATLDAIRRIVTRSRTGLLTSLECHDIMCHIGSAAVSGGVRRTAMISLFDFDDEDMLNSKAPGFEKQNSQRWNANNSAVWPDRKLSQVEIMDFMATMFKSGCGEPGIFNRRAVKNLMPERRNHDFEFGTNPCGEITLRPMQFCNLSAVVARPDDDEEMLMTKVQIATIIGTIQSMATNFQGLRPEWRKNCEEERLLGVDITGQMDCPLLNNTSDEANALRERLQAMAVETNAFYSGILGIPQASSVTCVKPSGNTSQLVNCSSGLHPRWSEYYIRRVRVDAKSPVYKVLRDSNVPLVPENGQDSATARTWVAEFPIKSPDGAITRSEVSAVGQAEFWKANKIYWTEHNPSVTINYRPDELFDIVKWTHDNQDILAGVTFLPYFEADTTMSLLPYESIDKERYEQLKGEFPARIDFSRLYAYEYADTTEAAQTLACMAPGQDC